MKLSDFRYEGKGKFSLKDYPTCVKVDKDRKAEFKQKTQENTAKLAILQDKLYAEGKQGAIIALQAMDAAGKDSTIKHVMSGVNPQGVSVTSFKSPNNKELGHDYLWRVQQAVPERGYIALFNRSHYEDVLCVRVHEYWKHYEWPKRCYDMSEKKFFENRFEQIRSWEEHLYQNGYRMIKIFLNVSLDEQKKRFLERIDNPDKNWKFSSGDLKERALWPQYMDAFEDAIQNTATEHCPWYIIPADKKWVMQYLVGQAAVDLLEDMDPQYPEMPEEEKELLAQCRAQLVGESENAEEPQGDQA